MTAYTPPIVYIGDDWLFPFTYKDGNGNPINLTGYTIGAELFVSYSATPQDLNVDNQGIIQTDLVNGQFSVFVSRSITSQVAATSIQANAKSPTRLQIFIIDPSGHRQTLGVLSLNVVAP